MMWYKFFLFLVALLPFGFALNPTETIDLPIIRLLIPAIFLLWILEGLLTKKLHIDIRPRFTFFFLFIFISCISLFWAVDPSLGFRKALFLASVAPIYFVAFSATFKKEKRLLVLKVLVFSGFFASIFALLQFSLQFIIGIDPTLEIMRTYLPFFLGRSFSELVFAFPSWMVNISGKTIIRTLGPFPDPHILSLYINMLIPLAFYLFFHNKNRFFLLAGSLMTITSALSFSRAAYLSLISGVLFFIFSFYGLKFVKKYFALCFFISLGMIFLVLVPNPLTQRLSSSINLSEGSNSGRIEMWEIAVDEITENPWKGIGIGNFAFLVNSNVDFRNPIYAHNIFLDFGAETGIINTLILFLVLSAPIFFFFKKKSPLSLAIATSFVFFLVHSMFETPLFSIQLFPLFCILLATKTND